MLTLLALGAGVRAQSVAPYASIATDGESYAGAGRAVANDLVGKVVRIGMLAPLHGARKAEGDAMVAAARIALQDAGGGALPGGRRAELVVRDESGPSWGAASDEVINLVMGDQVVAMITSTSGADAHLCEQVGNRIGVPVLTLAADATTTEIDIPWIFRMSASDDDEAKVVARNIYRGRGLTKVLLVTEQEHDGRRGVEAMETAAKELGMAAPETVMLDPLHADVAAVVKRIRAEEPQAVVMGTSAATARELLGAMQRAGLTTICYLSQSAAEEELGMGDASAKGAWMAAAEGEDAGMRRSFVQRYRQATGKVPGEAAMESYDAVTITMRALRVAGVNRARVRDELARVQNFGGASGRISFDHEGNDRAALHLVRMTEVQR